MSASEDKPARRRASRTRGGPTDLDAHVGRRIQQRRLLLGLSQSALADLVGVTFQQVQKYERGANRVGAGRLFEIAKALDVPVGYFFEGIEGGAPAAGFEGAIGPRAATADLTASRETIALVRAYYAILDPAVRRSLRDLMKAMVDGEDGGG